MDKYTFAQNHNRNVGGKRADDPFCRKWSPFPCTFATPKKLHYFASLGKLDNKSPALSQTQTQGCYLPRQVIHQVFLWFHNYQYTMKSNNVEIHSVQFIRYASASSYSSKHILFNELNIFFQVLCTCINSLVHIYICIMCTCIYVLVATHIQVHKTIYAQNIQVH